MNHCSKNSCSPKNVQLDRNSIFPTAHYPENKQPALKILTTYFPQPSLTLLMIGFDPEILLTLTSNRPSNSNTHQALNTSQPEAEKSEFLRDVSGKNTTYECILGALVVLCNGHLFLINTLFDKLVIF